MALSIIAAQGLMRGCKSSILQYPINCLSLYILQMQQSLTMNVWCIGVFYCYRGFQLILQLLAPFTTFEAHFNLIFLLV